MDVWCDLHIVRNVGGDRVKTPEEIKKGLELHLSDPEVEPCENCPYHGSLLDGDCLSALVPDALAYIQQLEAEIDRVHEQAKRLEDDLR